MFAWHFVRMDKDTDYWKVILAVNVVLHDHLVSDYKLKFSSTRSYTNGVL